MEVASANPLVVPAEGRSFGTSALPAHGLLAQSQPEASPSSILVPSIEPLDLSVLDTSATQLAKPGSCPRQMDVVTADTICQSHQTIPSLWWAKEQFGGQLLDNWVAYPHKSQRDRRVDLVVNQQAWSLLDYLEHYEFVHHFGTVAQDYGYNLRVFNRQGTQLAAYTCDFRTAPSSSLPVCQILLDASGKDILRGRPQP
ncbi:MAG: hypothetical protein VKJ46_03265 [Leptolyngbyaceae bacterium]|nr:hypothetical protein [Leptolyngbyaceae bacterium]